MLEFNEESKRLVSTFLNYRNDVDIYTEDEDKDKEFYRILFNRLLDGKVKINDITPLGCKENVLERCKNEPDNGRRKIFIVDGDINYIHEKEQIAHKNLYVLDAYCIENFLLERESIIQFIYLNCATKSKEQIEAEVGFENWLESYSKKFIELFIHFAILDFFGGRFTLYNAHRFHIQENGLFVFNESLIDSVVGDLRTEILKIVSEEEYEAKLKELQGKWTPTIDNLLKIVSGKDYLIPVLWFKTQGFKKSKSSPTLEEIKFSLAHLCSFKNLDGLKQAILNL